MTTSSLDFPRAVLYFLILVSPSASKWTQWTCDELTPSLCDLSVTKGYVSINDIRVKYWRYKRKQPLLGGQFLLPLIALHGGPSWPHGYLLPLRQLACRGTNEVIFYDQAGCGESALPEGTDATYPHLLTPSYYSDVELPTLIQHWKLDQYHLLGHSWGALLAQMFSILFHNATGLASLTLIGPLSDAKSYIDAQWDSRDGNLGTLPPFMQDRIHALEENHQYDSAEYQAIDDVLTTYFTLRTAPAPDCFTESAAGLNKDIYVGMQGASEFTMRGKLESFNLTARLNEIDVPVLLASGRFDTMRPSIVKTMQEQIRYVERKLLPHSGHVSMIDDAGLLNDVVADFLGRVERAQREGGASKFVPTIWEEEDKAVAISMQWPVTIFTATLAFVVGMAVGRCRKFKAGYAPIE